MSENNGCPKCGSKYLGFGELRGDARLYPQNKFFTLGSRLIATVCLHCGEIVSWRVDEPEKFGD